MYKRVCFPRDVKLFFNVDYSPAYRRKRKLSNPSSNALVALSPYMRSPHATKQRLFGRPERITVDTRVYSIISFTWPSFIQIFSSSGLKIQYTNIQVDW